MKGVPAWYVDVFVNCFELFKIKKNLCWIKIAAVVDLILDKKNFWYSYLACKIYYQCFCQTMSSRWWLAWRWCLTVATVGFEQVDCEVCGPLGPTNDPFVVTSELLPPQILCMVVS